MRTSFQCAIDVLWMTRTDVQLCNLPGVGFLRRSGSAQNNRPWSMECLCVHAAGSHEDRTSVDSPVVLSSFVSQLELGGIGRITKPSWLDKQVSHLVFFFKTPSSFFLADGGAGNYDIVNNAVVATPGLHNHRAQNASLRQSWEMNYQEAAIYLQVGTSWRVWNALVEFAWSLPGFYCTSSVST